MKKQKKNKNLMVCLVSMVLLVVMGIVASVLGVIDTEFKKLEQVREMDDFNIKEVGEPGVFCTSF